MAPKPDMSPLKQDGLEAILVLAPSSALCEPKWLPKWLRDLLQGRLLEQEWPRSDGFRPFFGAAACRVRASLVALGRWFVVFCFACIKALHFLLGLSQRWNCIMLSAKKAFSTLSES